MQRIDQLAKPRHPNPLLPGNPSSGKRFEETLRHYPAGSKDGHVKGVPKSKGISKFMVSKLFENSQTSLNNSPNQFSGQLAGSRRVNQWLERAENLPNKLLFPDPKVMSDLKRGQPES
jgi:hypothetical protein